ncbi:hypothetical protein LLEC1_02179 [Akanthomyces lecanii]|uniref:Cytochrome b561 domain-containing protein n=1 Tax=Cordyceps confragosa TaxID=2714763 RepID=A0A179I530_CORDF|nr:hypothetical protein LLEC1_02179 [Akanthomyces lecanii]
MAPSTALSQRSSPTQRKQVAQDKTHPIQDTLQQQEDEFSMAQLWNGEYSFHPARADSNPVAGTGFIAQIAVVTFSLSLSGRLLARPLVLFSWHPLSQISGLFLLVQSILALQPTHTAGQKRVGQALHAYLNLASFAAFTAGFAAIYLNKSRSGAEHFASLHGALGCALTLSLWGQYLVGFTMWATPALYGGAARARAIGSWVFYVPMALIAVGVLPRIHTYKLGFSKKA